MGRTLDEIAKEVCDFIAHPQAEGFDRLALEVFAFQFNNNPPYRNYCLRKSKAPDTISHWDEIPAVPAAAFKEMELTCLPRGKKPEAVFLTTGTTQGQQKRGRHLIPRLSVYEAAVLTNFEAHLLSDHARLRMVILTGSPSLWPHSSLAYMMELVQKAFGAPGSAYYIKEQGLDLENLTEDLKAAQRTGEPVFLIGITPAFHQLIEGIRGLGLTLSLPPGSRIMDTGGFKGHRTEISKEELYDRYEEMLGIPRDFIVNEYGMTEMGSQFYDNRLVNHLSGRPGPRFKTIPPWVRTTIINPETLEGVPPDTVGMLKHLDLANCGSVMALLTEDLGYAIGNGFELTGRIEGAEARGCSLLIEEIIEQRADASVGKGKGP